MMHRDDFWAQVDAALDARSDPLDQTTVQDYLLAHPEELEAYARLTSAVASLSQPVPVPTRPRRWLAGAAGLALAVVVGAGWWWPTRPAAGDNTEDLPLELPDPAATGAVLAFHARRYTESSDGRLVREIEAGTLSVHERETRTFVLPRSANPDGLEIRAESSVVRSRVRGEFGLQRP